MNLSKLNAIRDDETDDISRLKDAIMEANDIIKAINRNHVYSTLPSLAFAKDLDEVFEDMYLAITKPDTWKFTYSLQQLQAV